MREGKEEKVKLAAQSVYKMSKLCEVCVESDHKYKCPQCRLKYCSVKCFKQHKVVSCFPQEKKATVNASNKRARSQPEYDEVLLDDDESDDYVPREKLDRLDDSEEIKELLENPHLQVLLQHLDVSRNPQSDVSAAMQEPLLLEFADACLRVVEPERFPAAQSES